MTDIPYSAQITKRALLRGLMCAVLLAIVGPLLTGGIISKYAYRQGYSIGHDSGYSAGFRDGSTMARN